MPKIHFHDVNTHCFFRFLEIRFGGMCGCVWYYCTILHYAIQYMPSYTINAVQSMLCHVPDQVEA